MHVPTLLSQAHKTRLTDCYSQNVANKLVNKTW